MGGLVRKTGGFLSSLMFVATVGWAVEYGSKYFEEPQPIPQPAPVVEFIGPNYCTPGLEADEHDIGIKDTFDMISNRFDLSYEELKKYNSKLEDITAIKAGGTICLPPGTLESKL
jgi:hypothetical protein